MFRVLIAEDSPVQREFLVVLLEQTGLFKVVGTATNGTDAVDMCAGLRPDIAVVDCHMPVMNGPEVTRAIMERCPTPVVIVSAASPSDMALAFDAIYHGALAAHSKPTSLKGPLAQQLVLTLRSIAEAGVTLPAQRDPGPQDARGIGAGPTMGPAVEVVAVTGAAAAGALVVKLLKARGRPFRAPLVIALQFPPGFAGAFATWLAATTSMRVATASDGQSLQAGCAYVVPDGVDLSLEGSNRLAVTPGTCVEGRTHTVGPLLRSMARVHGAGAAGILLAGADDESALGLEVLRSAGGLTIAQDNEPGWPAEHKRLAAAQHVLTTAGLLRLVTSAP